MSKPDLNLPPDPDADMGELIGACLLAAVCLAITFAVVIIGTHGN